MQRTTPRQIEREGRFFDPPEEDDPKDSEDGPCQGKGCEHSHYKEICNVCGLSYGHHSGHHCPVGGDQIFTVLGNFESLSFCSFSI